MAVLDISNDNATYIIQFEKNEEFELFMEFLNETEMGKGGNEWEPFLEYVYSKDDNTQEMIRENKVILNDWLSGHVEGTLSVFLDITNIEISNIKFKKIFFQIDTLNPMLSMHESEGYGEDEFGQLLFGPSRHFWARTSPETYQKMLAYASKLKTIDNETSAFLDVKKEKKVVSWEDNTNLLPSTASTNHSTNISTHSPKGNSNLSEMNIFNSFSQKVIVVKDNAETNKAELMRSDFK